MFRKPNRDPGLSNHDMALRARLRPPHWHSLSAEEQWKIDKELGILDWDGSGDPELGRVQPPDEFTNAVWCLIFSMIETGVDGRDPWWGQDFLHVKQMLEARGLNCDPEKAPQ